MPKFRKLLIEYGFNKDYQQWLTPVQANVLVQARTYTSPSQCTSTSDSTRSSTSHSTETSTSHRTDKRKKERKKDLVASDTPFSLKEEIKKLEDSARRDLNIIALYFDYRKPDLQNRQQYEEALKRHLKPAGALKAFTDNQILKAMDYAQKEYKDIYTLETLIKILTK